MRACASTHSRFFSRATRIKKVKSSGGTYYVFLSGFWFIPSLEEKKPDEKSIFRILDRGVDGIMTDRPEHVRELIDKWLNQKSKSHYQW